MIAQHEVRLRQLAIKKGLELVTARQPTDKAGATAPYPLIVPHVGLRIYPQGIGAEGAPLHEIEEWLGFPWE
jgi:hypothetical protein